MTASTEALQIARLEERVSANDKRIDSIGAKLDTIQNLIVAVLISSVAGLIGFLANTLHK
jgi:hypothetical protein